MTTLSAHANPSMQPYNAPASTQTSRPMPEDGNKQGQTANMRDTDTTICLTIQAPGHVTLSPALQRPSTPTQTSRPMPEDGNKQGQTANMEASGTKTRPCASPYMHPAMPSQHTQTDRLMPDDHSLPKQVQTAASRAARQTRQQDSIH
jgi:hypothetical protein